MVTSIVDKLGVSYAVERKPMGDATIYYAHASGEQPPQPAARAVLHDIKGCVGECWSAECSADGTFEIFIVPTEGETSRIAGILAHELVHAAVGLEAKHGKPFKRVALAIGLEGRMTATTEGPRFLEAVKPILDAVGPFPHARLTDDPLARSSAPKKQAGRQLKCECTECGYIARTTAKWLKTAGAPICPTHNTPM
jgi:hypothetical protein